MARPRYAPGSIHPVRVRRRVGPVSLESYLAARLSLPRKWVLGLLEAGCVTRGEGERCIPGETLLLHAGERLEVRFPDDWPPHLQPRAMPLAVIYEDDDLAVLDKPAGIVVHPARGHLDCRTLQNGVLFRYRHLLGRPLTCIGPAHRLDKDTSGLVVFSLTRRAYRRLTDQFYRRAVTKEYLAVVAGVPGWEEETVAAPLGVSADDPRRGAVVPVTAGGKEALTRLRVLQRGNGCALVAAFPATGRPHQVRLHLAHLGFPVLGDRNYNPDPEWGDPPRQMLHAAALRLLHPVRGTPLRLRTPLPPRMRETCRRLGVEDEEQRVDPG